MQPNLGQGGCMAIEDGYQLAVDLTEACETAQTSGRPMDVEGVLKVRLCFKSRPHMHNQQAPTPMLSATQGCKWRFTR
jgi:hypothetical protein